MTGSEYEEGAKDRSLKCNIGWKEWRERVTQMRKMQEQLIGRVHDRSEMAWGLR